MPVQLPISSIIKTTHFIQFALAFRGPDAQSETGQLWRHFHLRAFLTDLDCWPEIRAVIVSMNLSQR